MKLILLFITLTIGQLSFFTTIKAADITDSTAVSKQYYHAAKEQFKDMLSGNEELSYEKAITIVENAYYENEVNLVDFNLLIDFHVQNINRIIEINYDESALQIEQVLHKTEEQQIEEYKNALTNWAIYSYITDTTLFLVNNQLSYHLPYEYSYKDPLGTLNWQNTQVFNLLDNKTGNCYALASLFKIFSERLNSEAFICTAPGHIYIRHADHKGIYHNVELGSKAFPGTGSLETLTYTTDEATKNGISLRELDIKQSVALNLVYLAKGYAYKFGVKDDDFIMECAELVLQYDELNLNAMLLKAEVLEEKLIKKDKSIKALQADKTFQEYEKLITHLFDLGYREMPTEMKDLVISRLRKEDSPYPMTNHTPKPFEDLGVKEERYATLSNGLFDEQMLTKPIEQYHRTMFDTKQKKITELVKLNTAYNNYPMDLVVFAWQIDPLANKLPSHSPYAAFVNNPILYTDFSGAFPFTFHVRAFAPPGAFEGFGFEDDNRGFSIKTSKEITSRIQHSFTVDPSKQVLQKDDPFSNESKKISTGEVKTATPTGDVTASFGKTSDGSAIASVNQEFEGSNPFFPSFLAPDIEVSSVFSVTEDLVKKQLNVSVDLYSKAFPATEAFIEDASGQKVFLSGAAAFGSPTDLILSGENKVGTANIIINFDDKGNFTNIQVGENSTITIDAFNAIGTSKPAGPNASSDFKELK